MRTPLLLILAAIALALLAALSTCKKEDTAGAGPGKPGGGEVVDFNTGTRGKVVETMSSGGYTYVKVDVAGRGVWAAAPEFVVKVGETVIIPEGMPMANYTSKTLNRTFDIVFFVSAIPKLGEERGGGAAAVPTGQMGSPDPTRPVPTDFSDVKKAEGGKTVAEVFQQKTELAGKEVVLRGKVVKFNAGIMGKNWFHVRDGTGAAGTDDLTVTTQVVVAVGDVVLLRGVLSADKDFGFGYKYAVLVEDAQVTKE